MNMNELNAHIKGQVATTVKEVLGAEMADVVREAVATALKSARPDGYVGRMLDDGTVPVRMVPQMERGLMMARSLRAIAAMKLSGGGGGEKVIEILKGWGSHDVAEAWTSARTKALAAGDPTGGGFLVPTQFSTDVIELLRPSAVVRSLNPLVMPMPMGSVKVPRIGTGATATYIGENKDLTKTQQVLEQITLSFKKLSCLVPISNDLIRYSSPSADTIVRDDMVRSMATREDKAFIRDDGTSGTPRGLKYWINPTNKFDATSGTVSVANVTIDLGRAIQKLMTADVPLIIQQFPDNTQAAPITARPGWIMSPRTYMYLTTVQNSNGFFVYRPEMMQGTLWGFPYRVTSQVLETLTAAGADTGGAQTELYFGAFAHAVIGEALAIMVDASTEAAYTDGSSTVSAFSQDQTVVRVLSEHDFALRHDKAFALIQKVTWGS
jgi:HK97 family phage major capsid protein